MNEFVRQRIGQTIAGRWTLQSVLGEGGMGAVYAATDADGSEVAIKVLHPEFGRESHTRERFLREGAVANRVDHPGVVRVMDHGVADGDLAYMVMEKLEGQSLRELIADSGRMALPDVLDVLDQVLDVLARAHEEGIVHRDLKPDNLFLLSDDTVKVLDFGVARILDDDSGGQRTKTGVAVGTVTYMAPEQAMGRRSEIDGRADLFALGATAFRALTGRRVHEANSAPALLVAMATQPAPPIASVLPHLPEPVARVIDLALAFDLDARYPDARTMRADVQALQRGERPPSASARAEALDAPTQANGVAAVAGAGGAWVAAAAIGAGIAPSLTSGGVPAPGVGSDGVKSGIAPSITDQPEGVTAATPRGQVASATPTPTSESQKRRWGAIAIVAVVLFAFGWWLIPGSTDDTTEGQRAADRSEWSESSLKPSAEAAEEPEELAEQRYEEAKREAEREREEQKRAAEVEREARKRREELRREGKKKHEKKR